MISKSTVVILAVFVGAVIVPTAWAVTFGAMMANQSMGLTAAALIVAGLITHFALWYRRNPGPHAYERWSREI